jgi:hypothetical protein
MSWTLGLSCWAGHGGWAGAASGRPRWDPGLRPALLALVGPQERGDPMSPLRWTTKSTRKLAAELTRQGHRADADTVGDLLREEGFSLQGNAKTIEGKRHPDRDAQFRYISEQVQDHQGTADPVISVDTKKKELVGEFKNSGREWRHHLPQVAIAALFSVRPKTINKRIRDIRQLLQQAGYAIQPGAHQLASLDDLASLAATAGITIPTEIKTAC